MTNPTPASIAQIVTTAKALKLPRARAMEPHSILADELGWTHAHKAYLALALAAATGGGFIPGNWQTVADVASALDVALEFSRAAA